MLDPAENDDGTMFNPLPSTDPKRVARAIAAPPLLTDGGVGGRTEPLGALSLSPKFGPGYYDKGIIAFADGGRVDADKLMADIAAKYGVSGKTQPEPPLPTPQPQPKPQLQPSGGLLQQAADGIRNRFKQADQAGYAQGGKIVGPGTTKSDSIQAKIRETGEEIRVSNGERIVSAEQDKFLEGVAQSAGYENLDAMLADGTGKPVGPTIKSGKRAAADGMAPTDPDTDGRRTYSPGYGDSFAARDKRVDAVIEATPTLGSAPLARSEQSAVGPKGGLTVNPSTFKSFEDKGGGIVRGVGSDKKVMITNVETSGVTDPTKPLPLANSIDLNGTNEIMARANKARGEMIDMSIAANGGNGVAMLGDGGIEAANAEKTRRWALDDMVGNMKKAGTSTERAALGQAINQTIAGQNQLAAESMRQNGIARGQDLSYGARMAQQGLTARSQELGLQKAQERNEVVMRGQDIGANTAAARLAQQGVPSLSQQRSNAEIDAARSRIAGLDPAEIKRKTANFTATGRENPDYDPTLAKAISLANRRKIGDDEEFDQRQQAQQPAGNDGDAMARFKADKAMTGHTLGKQTEQGVEVLDASGKLIGHYR